MKEIGEYLKNRRIELGISLDEVEQLLKIRKKYLIAIEDGNESALPGKTYFLGYLRNYANYLGVNQDEINQYLEKPVEKVGNTLEYTSQTFEPVDTEPPIKRRSKGKYISHRRNKIITQKEKKPVNIVPFLKLAMIVLLVGGFAFVFNQFVQKLKQPSIPKLEKEETSQETSIEQKMVEIAKGNIESENVMESEKDDNKLPALPDYKPIELTALEPSWIKISQDDQVLFEGIIEDKEKVIIKTDNLITLISSNPDNITVSYNDNILEPQPIENYHLAEYQILPNKD